MAARVGELTDHPGALSGPGEPTVLIEGKPAAVVGGTPHICAFPPPAGPHPPNNIATGSAKVFIGGRQAARLGDSCICGAHIVTGAATVLIA
jgi:uncharacterized Zn-binding protein involved in type VI secretion